MGLIVAAPGTLAAASAPPARIYVANAGDPSTITVLNATTHVVEASIPVRDAIAVGVSVAPNGKAAYALAVGSDERGSPGRLIPIATASNHVGAAIEVGTDPQSITFNPNGKFAYVVNGFDAATTPTNAPGRITPVNLAEGIAGRSINVGTNPGSMAVSPNGQIAYVADSNAISGAPTTITPVNLVTNTPGKAIPVAARAIAVTLNGQSALTLTSAGVVPISVASNRPGRTVALNGIPQALALAPDGQAAWVLTTPRPGSNRVELTALNTGTFALGKAVTLPAMPTSGQFFIAVTPDGAHIYVLGQGSGTSASTLVAVAASTDVASRPIKVGLGDTGLVASSNSKSVLVLSPGSDYQGAPIASPPKSEYGRVFPVSTASEAVGPPVSVGLLADSIAVTP
jgi:DNA-binding beta-propeller fold protein YncE